MLKIKDSRADSKTAMGAQVPMTGLEWTDAMTSMDFKYTSKHCFGILNDAVFFMCKLICLKFTLFTCGHAQQ